MKTRRMIAAVSLIVVLVVAACSGIDDPVVQKEYGELSFDFRPAGVESLSGELPTPDGIRVIVQDDDGFRYFMDVPVPATEVATVSLPARGGYEVAAFSYVDDPGTQSARIILKDALQPDIQVIAGEVTQVTLILDPVQLSIVEAPSSVVSGESYEVLIARETNIPHQWVQLFLSLAPIPGFDHQPATTDSTTLAGNGSTVLMADNTEEFSGQTVYNTVLSAIDDKYVNHAEGEYATLFHIITPSVVTSDGPVVTDIIGGSGDIEVIVIYGE